MLFLRLSEQEWAELERKRTDLGLKTYTDVAKRALIELRTSERPAKDSRKRRAVA
ncbi:MAG: hypothetical protein V2A73_12940 [Pseudomonadota bacterium]